MPRIFTSLSVVAILLMLTNIGLGLATGDYNGHFAQVKPALEELNEQIRDANRSASTSKAEIDRLKQDRKQLLVEHQPFKDRAGRHILMGIATALVVVLVNSISVTYFIGTSRWCREVTEAYNLDAEIIQRANGIKRGSFPWSLGGMLVILVVIALGAAANPGSIRPGTADWVMPHYWGAVMGTGLIGWSFWHQRNRMQINQALIEEVLRHVERIRQQRQTTKQANEVPQESLP